MRRLASLVRRFFGPRVRRPIDDDPSLPFTPEEFGRLIRSGRREDMKLLAEGLACPDRSAPHQTSRRALDWVETGLLRSSRERDLPERGQQGLLQLSAHPA